MGPIKNTRETSPTGLDWDNSLSGTPPTAPHPAAIPPENQCPHVDAVDSCVPESRWTFPLRVDPRRLSMTYTTHRQDALSCLLNQFGFPPYDDKNKGRFCTRLSTILGALQQNPALKLEEKGGVYALPPNSLFRDPHSLSLVLNAAYKSSLVALFLDKVSFPENASLDRKTTLVREYIQNNKETITELQCTGRWITCFPEELCEPLSRLRTLNLASNLLSSLPDSFGLLSALEYLDLMRNDLKKLPASFGLLSALKNLILHHNRLRELPDSFGELSALECLDITENRLRELPHSVGALSALQGLYLKHNRFRELPDSLGNLAALKTIYLDNSSLLDHFPESFKNGLNILTRWRMRVFKHTENGITEESFLEEKRNGSFEKKTARYNEPPPSP